MGKVSVGAIYCVRHLISCQDYCIDGVRIG